MDLNTRRRVFSELGELLITRETVAVDTPACNATSAIVDLALFIVGRSLSIATLPIWILVKPYRLILGFPQFHKN